MIVNCNCGGSYRNNVTDFDHHTKTNPYHLAWIKSITINCQCGEDYNDSNQINHFKRSRNHIA